MIDQYRRKRDKEIVEKIQLLEGMIEAENVTASLMKSIFKRVISEKTELTNSVAEDIFQHIKKDMEAMVTTIIHDQVQQMVNEAVSERLNRLSDPYYD